MTIDLFHAVCIAQPPTEASLKKVCLNLNLSMIYICIHTQPCIAQPPTFLWCLHCTTTYVSMYVFDMVVFRISYIHTLSICNHPPILCCLHRTTTAGRLYLSRFWVVYAFPVAYSAATRSALRVSGLQHTCGKLRQMYMCECVCMCFYLHSTCKYASVYCICTHEFACLQGVSNRQGARPRHYGDCLYSGSIVCTV